MSCILCHTGSQLVLGILTDCKVVGFALLQLGKHQVNGILKFFIILPDFHGIDKLNKGGEVLFLHRCFIVDVADERGIEQGFRL